jgi:hypothetical protein
MEQESMQRARVSPWLKPVAAAAGAGLLACLGAAFAAPEPTRSPFMPSATVAELMESIVMPAADVLWNAVAVDVTAQGVVETIPQTDEEWERVRWSAVALGEAANLVLIPGRRVDVPGAGSEAPDAELEPLEIQALIERQWPAWVAHAEVLHSAAMEALAAVDAHDVDALTEAGGTIDAACESCHVQFWYPNQ